MDHFIRCCNLFRIWLVVDCYPFFNSPVLIHQALWDPIKHTVKFTRIHSNWIHFTIVGRKEKGQTRILIAGYTGMYYTKNELPCTPFAFGLSASTTPLNREGVLELLQLHTHFLCRECKNCFLYSEAYCNCRESCLVTIGVVSSLWLSLSQLSYFAIVKTDTATRKLIGI